MERKKEKTRVAIRQVLGDLVACVAPTLAKCLTHSRATFHNGKQYTSRFIIHTLKYISIKRDRESRSREELNVTVALRSIYR